MDQDILIDESPGRFPQREEALTSTFLKIKQSTWPEVLDSVQTLDFDQRMRVLVP